MVTYDLLKINLVDDFNKSMECIGKLIDWTTADISIWINFQVEIVRLIDAVSIHNIASVIEEGVNSISFLENELNCSTTVCNLIRQLCDALVCKYKKSIKEKHQDERPDVIAR